MSTFELDPMTFDMEEAEQRMAALLNDCSLDSHEEALAVGTLLQSIEVWGNERKLTDTEHSSAIVQGLKFVSEVGELADNLAKGKDVKDDIGDCIVVLVMIARLKGVTLLECLETAYNDIKDRKGVMHNGVFIKSTDALYAELVGEDRKDGLE